MRSLQSIVMIEHAMRDMRNAQTNHLCSSAYKFNENILWNTKYIIKDAAYGLYDSG